MRFQDLGVVVTGCAQGLGQTTAQLFAAEGATVFGVDINEAGLNDTEKLISDAGGSFSSTVANIADRMTAHGAIANAMDTMGRIDVLANVAGVLRNGHFTDLDEKDYDLMMGVNVAGTTWMCQAAIPHLMDSRGNIVNVASVAGMRGQAYTVGYCASKAAVVNLTRALAMEYMRKHIRVNAIAPGGIQTAMVDETVFPDDVNWRLIERYSGNRKISTTNEVANAIIFLASGEASAIHGEILATDEGILAG